MKPIIISSLVLVKSNGWRRMTTLPSSGRAFKQHSHNSLHVICFFKKYRCFTSKFKSDFRVDKCACSKIVSRLKLIRKRFVSRVLHSLGCFWVWTVEICNTFSQNVLIGAVVSVTIIAYLIFFPVGGYFCTGGFALQVYIVL